MRRYGFFEGWGFEFFAGQWIFHGKSRMGSHQSTNSGDGIDTYSTNAWSHPAILTEDTFLDPFANKMQKVGSEQRVIAPKCFGVIAKGDECSHCLTGFFVKDLKHAKT